MATKHITQQPGAIAGMLEFYNAGNRIEDIARSFGMDPKSVDAAIEGAYYRGECAGSHGMRAKDVGPIPELARWIPSIGRNGRTFAA